MRNVLARLVEKSYLLLHAQLKKFQPAFNRNSFYGSQIETSFADEVNQLTVNGQQEIGYRCIRIDGQLPSNTTGILISLVKPLTDAGISIFAVSTFSSDYVFLMEEHLVHATQALQHAGHEFVHEE